MKQISKQLTVTALALTGLMVASGAQANMLTGSINVDNSYSVYLSTDDSVMGTWIAGDGATPANPTGGDIAWAGTEHIAAVALAPTVNYFIHVFGHNHATGGPAGLLADFDLSDVDHVFANGTGLSDDSWLTGSGWGTWDSTTEKKGDNGDAPWGALAGVDSAADWIWAAGEASPDQSVYFSLAITATDTAVIPVPSAVWLFGTGLVGFMGMRKKASKATTV